MHILVSSQGRHPGLEFDNPHDLIRRLLFDLAVFHDGDEALRLAALDDEPGPDLLSGEDWRRPGGVDGDGGRGRDDDHFWYGDGNWGTIGRVEGRVWFQLEGS